MADFVIPTNQRDFRCSHCDGKILIPRDLPPTTGPCPHCGGVITSPALDIPVVPVTSFELPVQVSAPTAIPAAPIQEVTPGRPIEESVVMDQPIPAAPDRPAYLPPRQAAPPEMPASEPTYSNPAPVVASKIELPAKDDHSERNKPKKKQPSVKAPKQRSGLIPAMLVLLVVIVLGAGAIYFASKELGKTIEAPVVKSATGDPAANEANYIRIGWQKDAYEVLSQYMAATETKTKLPYILNAAQLEPKIESFYGGGSIVDSDTPAEAFSVYELSEEDRKRGLFMMIYDQPPQFEMREFFRPLASLEVQYGVDEADLLLSTLARVGNFAMDPLRVHAFFKKTPEGLKLDWEIFVQTKYRTLQNFVELPESGQAAVFRVFIVEDVPDKGKAIAGTRTYRIVDPANTGDVARVNVKVDSEMGKTLSLINWRGTKENRPITRTATVELKWSGEASSPELEISRFICWEFLGLGGQGNPSTTN